MLPGDYNFFVEMCIIVIKKNSVYGVLHRAKIVFLKYGHIILHFSQENTKSHRPDINRKRDPLF